MNMTEMYANLSLLEGRFAGSAKIRELQEALPIFVPSYVDDMPNQKQYDRMVAAYKESKAYDLQMQAISKLKDIRISHILGCNDVVLAHLVSEYAGLKSILKDMSTALDSLKQYASAYKIASELKTAVKFDIGLMLKNDLETFQSMGVDMDITKLMTEFKVLSA